MAGKSGSDEEAPRPPVKRPAPIVVPTGRKHPSGNPVSRWVKDKMPAPQPRPARAPAPPPPQPQPPRPPREPLQRATIQMLPGRLQPLDPRVLQQEIRFIRLAGKTQSFTIGWNIGEPPAHITLNHASVRPLHAKMTYREGGWWIECLALLDPLLVNESELSLSDSPRALSDGDRITIGSVAFRFCLP